MAVYSSQSCGRKGGSRANVLVGLTIALLGVGPWLIMAVSCGQREAHVPMNAIEDLKVMGLAAHGFNDVYKMLPPAYDGGVAAVAGPASVHVHLMPYIEADNLYKQFVPTGKGPTDEIVEAFQSTRERDATAGNRRGVQNFAANLRVFSTKGLETKCDAAMPALAGIEPGIASVPRTFNVDGTSNTILFATKFATCSDGGSRYAAAPNSMFAAFFGQNPASKPAAPNEPAATFQLNPNRRQCLVSPLMAQSFSTGGLRVCLADVSVRTISPKISPEIWNLAVHPNDGKKMPQEWGD